ncbi:MAG: hypothetical protein B7Z52_04400, partial [Burkholderiales bacterium 12-64-5]
MATDIRLKERLPELTDRIVDSYQECCGIHHLGHCPLPSMDGEVGENGANTVRVVEKEGPASVECKDMPPPTPVDENEEPPPVDP